MGSYQTAITINDVLNNIHSRKYLIPAIQRKYVWTTEQIEALFDSIMRKIKTDIECAYTRHLDSKNTRSPSQTFYTDKALMEIKTQYENTN